MQTNFEKNEYVLGNTDRELKRLEVQSGIFDQDTDAVLHRAGIEPGMQVLDIGCGVGDVSMIASELVGPRGSVVGIDRSQAALDIAARRSRTRGLSNIRFECRDINAAPGHERFDAVVGRFILLHFRDPVSVVRNVSQHGRAGGIVAFAEMDIRSASVMPPMRTLSRYLGWITSLYEKAGLDPDMGCKLYATLRKAGLNPELSAACRIEAGSSARGLAFVIETLRSMRPNLLALGIADESELDIDRMARSLATEAADGDHCVIYPRLIGASARI